MGGGKKKTKNQGDPGAPSTDAIQTAISVAKAPEQFPSLSGGTASIATKPEQSTAPVQSTQKKGMESVQMPAGPPAEGKKQKNKYPKKTDGAPSVENVSAPAQAPQNVPTESVQMPAGSPAEGKKQKNKYPKKTDGAPPVENVSAPAQAPQNVPTESVQIPAGPPAEGKKQKNKYPKKTDGAPPVENVSAPAQAPQNVPTESVQMPAGPPAEGKKQKNKYPKKTDGAPSVENVSAPAQAGQNVPTESVQMPGGPPAEGKRPKNKYPKKTTEPPAQATAPAADLSATLEKVVISVPSSTSVSKEVDLYTGRKVGTLGRKMKVEGNYLSLNMTKMIDKAYHYDIVFDPDRPKKFLRLVFNEFRSNFPNNFLAFDGYNNFYSNAKLKINGTTFKTSVEMVLDPGRPAKKFNITIKEAAEVDLKLLKNFTNQQQFDKPQAAVQCLNVVLMEVFNNNRTVRAGRSFFDPPEQSNKLGNGYELWIGLFQSAILGWRPYLNVDVAHKAFPCAISLMDFIAEFDRDFNPNYELKRYTLEDCESSLRGFRIGYKSPFSAVQSSSCRLFNGFKNSAERQTFKNQDGKTLTIEAYFREKGVKLKFPKLPCVWVGPAASNIYLPAEYCFIPPGQVLNRKIPENCVANMIRYAATSTTERKRKIFDLLRRFTHNNVPVVKGFGVTIGDKFEQLDARVLAPPNLEYSNNKTVTPFKGVWRAEGVNFLKPAKTVNKWAVFNVNNRVRDPQIREFEKCFVQMAKKLGISIAPLSIIREAHNPQDKDIDHAMTIFKDNKIELVVVIIPDSGNTYSKIKLSAEIRFGLLTQCIKGRTMTRMNISTAANILLKDNAKLNGNNHKITGSSLTSIMKEPFMVMGADVTHPSPEQTTIPSVVGVVASTDKDGFKYKASWRLQNPKDEMIRDLENITIESLNYFKSIHTILPRRILYFRDGVSEGQFKEIMNIELRAIQAACGRVQPNYKPKVTFVVVQKRHHTRFFPTKRDQSDGKHENVLPGTIVDTEIVHPNQFQYYLVSHASIQGVAKPTKYCVLYDDSNLSADDLQKLTYDLCHMFSRCTRAVSYPAPTYYAHLVAARGRAYIETSRIQLDKLEWEYESRRIHTNIINDHPMFFV